MSYNIDELEKAFGVDQGDERPRSQQQYQKPIQREEEEKVMDSEYLTKVHENFDKELRRVGQELQELEDKVNRKRLEFAKLQGAFELVSGFKRDLA